MNPHTLKIWRSGFVNRWHNHPNHALRNSQDTNDAHMGRCVRLAIALFPGDWDLVDYLAHHDCPEVVSGDIPGPAKRGYGGLANGDAFIAAEWFAANHIDVTSCNRAKLIDKLDAYLFAREYGAIGSDWDDYWMYINDLAAMCRVQDEVAELLNDQ